jgi:hypothetical protein
MRSLNIALLGTFALLACAVAEAATCKFANGAVDRLTNEQAMSTKWDSLTSTMGNMFGKAPEGLHDVKAAAVSAWFKGDSAYLAIRINLEDHISMEPPPYELEGSIFIPGDSRLLILMDDGAILKLTTKTAARFDATFVPPGAASNTGFRKTDNNDFVKSNSAQSTGCYQYESGSRRHLLRYRHT